MNNRERMLLILVATAAGLLVAKVVVGKYSGTLKGYDAQVRQLKKELDKSNLEQTKAQIARLQWLEAGAQTLSMDANEATIRFREELERLGEKSKLADVDVSLESTPKPWQKKGVRVLNATLTGQGKFEDVVGFLYELHREPFAVRVKSLTLDQVSKPTKRGAKPTNPGLLKMTLYVDTLMLPACELVAQITPADLDTTNRKPTSRPAEATLAGYKPLIDRKLFQPYEPEAVVRPQDPRPPRPTTQVVQQTQQPNPVVPPPQPPPDAAFVLGRLLSSPRGQLAVLEDRARNGEDVYKEVGDEMYAGTLIFVHPSGAVTEKDGQLRYHAIGDQLQNFKPLTENDQPVVYEELMKLEKQATGISARPQ